jgi:hypothetical protein
VQDFIRYNTKNYFLDFQWMNKAKYIAVIINGNSRLAEIKEKKE